MPIQWIPIFPVWLIAFVALGLVGLLVHGSWLLSQKAVPAFWLGILTAIRMVVILVFTLCLLQPVVSCQRTVKQGPPLLVLIDASESMSMPDPSGKMSRLEEVLHWLKGSGLGAKLAKLPNTAWFAFDQSARPIEPADLEHLHPTGSTTRFGESLAAAWDYYRLIGSQNPAGSPPPGRVLLISDGNDFGENDAVSVAQKLGLTIDTLAPSSAAAGSGGADVAIVSVQTPRRVLMGSESRLLVTLRQEGMANRMLALNLKESAKMILTRNLTFSTGEQEKMISLPYHPSEIGIKECQVEVVANPPDAVKDNNLSKTTIQVLGSKNEVLFFEESWRWEFKFLRRIFEDDPSFTFSGFLLRENKAFTQFGEPERKINLGGFPQTRAELERFDTFILGDINLKRWPKSLIPALNKLVIDEGKSLILIAGPNIVELLDIPEIASILPVELTRESAAAKEGPVPVRISPEGAVSTFFHNADGGLAAWGDLKPLDQIYPPLRKRPAATILLEAASERNSYGPLIVVAEHTVGRGRVMYVGTDTLWKWQTTTPESAPGASPYILFWQQALRSLAPTRLSTGNVNLWLQPERSRYRTGESVRLRADLQSDRPIARPKLQGQVIFPDNKQIPLDFAPHPTQAGAYVAEFEATITGQIKITADVFTEGKSVANVMTTVDVGRSTSEMSNVHVNEANLARIAGDTGGRKIERAKKETWPATEKVERVPVQQTRILDLWNNFTLLILLTILLGADWIIRLLKGYV